MPIERHQVFDKVYAIRQRLDLLPDTADRSIAATALADLVGYIDKVEQELTQAQGRLERTERELVDANRKLANKDNELLLHHFANKKGH